VETLNKPPPLIDTGLNLANKRFRNDTLEVLEKARAANIAACILTGTSEVASAQVLALCQKYATSFPDMLSCTIGIHPHEAEQWGPESRAFLQQLLAHPQAVAIGETGLDFNRDYSPRDVQEKVFEAHLELAASMGKPVFMHERDAHQRHYEILCTYRPHITNGVIHCFTGSKESLFKYLDLDLHIGVTGWICDERRGQILQDIVKNIPLNRLMLESDAPYLLPRNIKPKPSSGRNEPAFLHWILDTVAAHRPEDVRQIANATTRTAINFFGLARDIA
jgi:TatD DNase family protein